MPEHDGGLMASLAQWIVNALAALQYEGVSVFNSAELWRHQILPTAGDADIEALKCFAFVNYMDDDTAREGDKDLREIPTFDILVGVSSKVAGVCKWGDATHLGTSRIRDLIIDLFDKKRPDDETVVCDEFYYAGSVTVLDRPRSHVIQMSFEVSQMNV
jgi:hypothetical protein